MLFFVVVDFLVVCLFCGFVFYVGLDEIKVVEVGVSFFFFVDVLCCMFVEFVFGVEMYVMVVFVLYGFGGCDFDVV